MSFGVRLLESLRWDAVRCSERAVFENAYVKRQGIWKILRASVKSV